MIEQFFHKLHPHYTQFLNRLALQRPSPAQQLRFGNRYHNTTGNNILVIISPTGAEKLHKFAVWP
jgi:hypothetical protein